MIPVEVAERVPDAAAEVMREESVIIEASKRSDFGFALLERLLVVERPGQAPLTTAAGFDDTSGPGHPGRGQRAP